MSQNSEKYDIVVDINSIMKLNQGWEIKYFGDEEKIINSKRKIKTSNKNFISVLGHSNRGKTYILQKLSGVDLKSGYQIHTKGISIKIPEHKNIMLLDTQGTNAPLLLQEGEEDKRRDPNL
jgi:ABC-type nitrate/sulfonate/bicarbonate transport system ATPase subunit